MVAATSTGRISVRPATNADSAALQALVPRLAQVLSQWRNQPTRHFTLIDAADA
jgi:hypothetical protein